MLRRFVFVLVACGSLGLLPAGALASAACPNEQLRQESNSLNLPDCRAYEQVSAQDKENNDTIGGLIAAGGEHATYMGKGAFAGAPRGGANSYLAARTAAGWRTTPLTPALPLSMASSGIGVGVNAINADASQILLQTGDPLDPSDTIANSTDLYLRGPGGGLTWISSRPASIPPNSSGYDFFPGAQTADLSHILFQSTQQLVNAAAGLDSYGYGLYEWTNGALRLVNLDSHGALLSAYGAALGGGISGKRGHAVSTDGERIYFSTPEDIFPAPESENLRRIFLRQSGQTTTDISASQCTEPACQGPAQEAVYQGAAADGSVAFFTSSAQLTNEATLGGGLYRYDVATGKLALLTPDVTGAGVLGEVGNSDDGSLVYYVAGGVLAAGVTAGANNLYLYNAKTSHTTFIATLEAGDSVLWTGSEETAPVGATPSGLDLVFQAVTPLTTGYETAGYSEIYRYDEPTQALTCLTCVPAGVPAQGNSTITYGGGSLVHNISDDGSRVFFQSSAPLVPLDRNGKINVYEWQGGTVSLISSGTSLGDSAFTSATASGSDVLFTTDSRLVPQDGDDQLDVYDARVDGGFASPPVSVGCSGAGCHGTPPSAPGLPFAASTGLSGSGNLTAPLSRPAAVKSLTKAQKLAKALRACRRDGSRKGKRKRAGCEARARSKYGPRTRTKQTTRSSTNGKGSK